MSKKNASGKKKNKNQKAFSSTGDFLKKLSIAPTLNSNSVLPIASTLDPEKMPEALSINTKSINLIAKINRMVTGSGEAVQKPMSPGKEEEQEGTSNDDTCLLFSQTNSPIINSLPVQSSNSFPEINFLHNGIARIYNQFPRRYADGIEEMITDLPRIANMGFNVVWINPIQAVGQAFKRNGSDKGSLYAMADDELFNDQFFPGIDEHEQRIKLIQLYTSTARSLGLNPIFDLVLNHVAKDSDLEDKFTKFLKKESQTKSWDDVVPFDYEEETKRNTIIEPLWHPFIEKYISKYGFTGVRVDAITNINSELQKKVFSLIVKFAASNKFSPIILGELLVGDPQKHIDKLKDIGFTHVLVPGSLYKNFHTKYKLNTNYDNVKEKCFFLQQAWDLQKIIFNSNQCNDNKGGTVGMSGNHDAAPLYPRAYFEKNGLENKELYNALRSKDDYPKQFNLECVPIMKARLLRISMTCNGGWYLLAGDEFAVLTWPSVFDNYNELESLSNNWGGKADLSQYIGFLNYILLQLPKAQQGDWVNHKKVSLNNELLHIVKRHSAFTGRDYFICASDQTLNLDKILKETGGNSDIYFINANQLHYYKDNNKQWETVKVDFSKTYQEAEAYSFYRLGIFFLSINKYEKAKKYFLKSTQQQQQQPIAFQLLGICHFKLGSNREAKEAFQLAFEFNKVLDNQVEFLESLKNNFIEINANEEAKMCQNCILSLGMESKAF